jgi:hypothetical protein
MSFVSPMIFWIGLGTVAIPIIIHLLNRRRFRIRQWAAMQFLLDSLRRNRRRLRIEELILMALRCLLLFLLAMAIARFSGCGDNDLLPGADQAPESTVFILDDSFSMAQKIGGPTVLENAIKDLTSHIKRLSETAKADQIAILLTSRPGVDDAFQAFMPVNGEEEIDRLIARIEAITLSDSPARLGEALAAAGEMLASKDKPKNVFVLSDFRAVDLGRGKSGQYQTAFKALDEQEVRVVTLDYGRMVNSNLTVEKVELLNKWALAGVSARVGVTVRNNGSVRLENVPVAMSAKWRADNKDVAAVFPAEAISSISPGSSVRIEFAVTLPKQGSAALKVELPPDHLAGDNAGHLALNVRKSLRILLVDGHPDMTDPAMSEAYRLALLLDPQNNASHGNEVTVVTSDLVGAQNFRDYDLVLLLDVPSLPKMRTPEGKDIYPLVMSLERYVRDGGGLGIFTGDNLNLAFYNGPMYAEGLGLSPLVIGPPRGDSKTRDKYRRLDARSISGDDFLRSLRGEGGAIRCGMIRFFTHTPADVLTASAPSGDIKPPRVVAKFTAPDGGDGPPAIVVRQFGKGTVMMHYSTASVRWNDWADDEPESVYSAPMVDMMMYLARSQAGLFTMGVGEPIVKLIDRDSRDATVTVRTPKYPADDVITLEIVTDGVGEQTRKIAKYDNPPYAGSYTMSLKMPDGSQSDLFFARNVDPVEGDLTPGGRKLIARAMGSEDFKYVSRRAAGSTADVQTKEQKDYWLLFLVGLLALLAIETFLAQRFGHYTGS